jgi:signal transduction histidine kinase
MIEAEVQAASLVERALKKGGIKFSFQRVESKAGFLRELKRSPPAVILSDHGLRAFDGFAALALAQERAPGVPFIFVASALGEEMASQAFKRGAADFVLKHRLGTLPSAIRRALGQTRLRLRRKQAEEEVRRQKAELEKQVAERTEALAVATKELENFSYSVSHDLRAPLRHINGFVEIFLATKAAALDEESRRYLETIAASAKLMGRLLDDLLTFSRTARAELDQTRVALADLVPAVIRDLQPESRDRAVEWVVSPLPEVDADPVLLRQVLLNLIGNALKFTRGREVPRIEIGSRSNRAEHVFFVRDNGVGFDPRYAHKLFGVFQRLHRAAEFEGTGIGLAIVSRIIHRHGGRTWAEGRPDKGATFFVALPKAAIREV